MVTSFAGGSRRWYSPDRFSHLVNSVDGDGLGAFGRYLVTAVSPLLSNDWIVEFHPHGRPAISIVEAR